MTNAVVKMTIIIGMLRCTAIKLLVLQTETARVVNTVIRMTFFANLWNVIFVKKSQNMNVFQNVMIIGHALKMNVLKVNAGLQQ